MTRFHIYVRLGYSFMDDWQTDAPSIRAILDRNEISNRLGEQGFDWMLITVDSDQPPKRDLNPPAGEPT
jgi:hypothetical protein